MFQVFQSRAFVRLFSVLVLVLSTACTATPAPSPTAAPAKPAALAPAPAPAAPAPAQPAAPASPAAAAAAKPTESTAAKPAPKPASVKLAVAGEVMSYAPTAVAVAGKLFEEQGLTVDRILVPGDSAVNTAIQAGDVQFGALGSPALLSVTQRGGKRLAVYGLMNTMALDLVVNNAYMQAKGVSPTDPYDKRLKSTIGGRFGSFAPGGLSEVYSRYLVKLAGGNPAADLEIVNLGGAPQILAGFKQGAIDGFTLSPPTGPIVEAEGSGKILIKGTEVNELKGYHATIIMVDPDYARQNADVVKRFNVALTSATDLMHKQPEQAAQLLQSYYNNASKEVLQSSVASLASGLDRGGRMSVEGWQKVVEVEQALAPEMRVDVRAGEGSWWTNEYLP